MPTHSRATSSSMARCFAFMAEAFMPSGWIVLPSGRGRARGRHLIVQDRLLALGRVESVDQGEALVVLGAERDG